MTMRWSDEWWVKLYTRDTADWLSWRWEARAVLPLLLRKVDRAGIIQVRPGSRRLYLLASVIGLPVEVTEPGMADLLDDGAVIEVQAGYFMPNFPEAQAAAASDKLRKAISRAKAGTKMLAEVTKRELMSRNVTGGHEMYPDVTKRDQESRIVTENPAVNTVTKRDRRSRNVTFCPPAMVLETVTGAVLAAKKSRNVTGGHETGLLVTKREKKSRIEEKSSLAAPAALATKRPVVVAEDPADLNNLNSSSPPQPPPPAFGLGSNHVARETVEFDGKTIELSPDGLRGFWEALREDDDYDPDPLLPINWDFVLEAASGLYGDQIVNVLQGLYCEIKAPGKPFAVLIKILGTRLAKAAPKEAAS